MKHHHRVAVAVLRLIVVVALVLCPAAGFAGTTARGGLSYSPSGVFAYADLDQVNTARLRADLTQLSAVTRDIRTYTMARNIDSVPAIAVSLGIKVTLGVWLGRDKTNNNAEVAKAIEVVNDNPAAITRVIVGDEALQREDMGVKDIVAAMAAVRRGIKDTGIPVGTAENWNIWLDNPKLAAGSDFIAAHINPYWNGVTVDDAPADVATRYDALAQKFPGKPIVIGETGWPSLGPVRQGAVPSRENQAQFIKAFVALAQARGFTYFMIEAYDQPWKIAENVDPCLWGMFDVRRASKAAIAEFIRR